MTRLLRLTLLPLLVGLATNAAALDEMPDDCAASGLKVQVLGSGADDFVDGRAGSSYLLWADGKARALIDIGSASAMRFQQSGARAADLDVVLLSHLHTDHTADLPTLIATALRERRNTPLPLYGPTGNRFAPATVAFVRSLFEDTRGAYRYLGSVLSPLAKDSFRLEAHEVRERALPIGKRRENTNGVIEAYSGPRLQASAAYVTHGIYPTLAWAISIGNRRIVFAGDTNGEGGVVERLAQGADLLIAPYAVPEGTSGVDRFLHAPPSVIGRIAAEARVKRLILTHRTQQSARQDEAGLAAIRAHYNGPVIFADDLSCFQVPQ